jgi:hypothetical protein
MELNCASEESQYSGVDRKIRISPDASVYPEEQDLWEYAGAAMVFSVLENTLPTGIKGRCTYTVHTTVVKPGRLFSHFRKMKSITSMESFRIHGLITFGL